MQHKFYISTPSGEFEFQPKLSEITFAKERYKEECFYRETFEGTMRIDDKELFMNLYGREIDRCRCNVDAIRISEECCDELNQNRWEGIFSFIDGTWDVDNCTVDFKARVEDDYSCLIKLFETEKNYLDIDSVFDVKTRFGQLKFVVCTEGIPPDYEIIGIPLAAGCIDTSTGVWNPSNSRIIGGANPNGQQSWGVRTEWVTEFVPLANGQPPGQGWVQLSDGWYRAVGTQFKEMIRTASGLGQTIEWTYSYIDSDIISGGRRFGDVLLFYLSDCFTCIRSNFFGINPDGTNPNNLAYQLAEQNLWNIAWFQASDVIFADAQVDASNTGGKAGRKKFGDLWDDLRKMFDLCMFLDGDCLRIEHVSYTRAQKQLDLTASKYVRHKYKANKEDIPLRQILSPKFKTDHIDFDDGNIKYQDECSDDEGQDKEVKLKCFTTNILRLFNNEDYLDDDNAINSVVLVSLDDADIINSHNGHKSGVGLMNGILAMSNVVRYWWTYDRPACQGDVNGQGIAQFESVKKTREMDQITLPIDCKVYNDLIPEITSIKTKIGIGEIKKIEWTSPKESKINILI